MALIAKRADGSAVKKGERVTALDGQEWEFWRATRPTHVEGKNTWAMFGERPASWFGLTIVDDAAPASKPPEPQPEPKKEGES